MARQPRSRESSSKGGRQVRPYLNIEMKVVTPLRLGVIGIGCFVGGLTWFAILFRSARPVLNIDVTAPLAPRLLGIGGFWLTVASVIWGVAARFRRKRERTRIVC